MITGGLSVGANVVMLIVGAMEGDMVGTAEAAGVGAALDDIILARPAKEIRVSSSYEEPGSG